MIDLPAFILAEARRAQHFAALVERIEKLNNLEQAEAESRARLAKLEREEATAKVRLEALTGKLVSAQNNAAAFMAEVSAIAKTDGADP